MRQQFKNLDTWRGKLTATWVILAPPTAMVAVFVAGGVTSNTFIVDAHALAQPRQDAQFDELVDQLPTQPGADGSLPTQQKSQIQVPVTGAVDGPVQPIPRYRPATRRAFRGQCWRRTRRRRTSWPWRARVVIITWPLLAGIGKVESAHASGGRVEANGNTRGKILGPVLDGGPGMAAITDTDQGLYDGNTAWDRAVGPMQFIPGTWQAFGADGNGDGSRTRTTCTTRPGRPATTCARAGRTCLIRRAWCRRCCATTTRWTTCPRCCGGCRPTPTRP